MSTLRAIGNELGSLDSKQWAAVLRLSSKLGLSAVREHAIVIFDTVFSDQAPFARLDLARRCQVSKWFQSVYRQLCGRPESLTLPEAEQLGLPQFVAICRIRDALSRTRLEDLVRGVDGRLDAQEVSLDGRCGGCRQRVTVSGRPFEGANLCRGEAERNDGDDVAMRLADMVADAEELRVAF